MNTPFAVPDPEDDATPYPVTLDRVLASVRAMGYQLDVVEEGRSVGAIFDSIPFLVSFDSGGRFMSVRGAWMTGLDGAEAQHPMFAAADNWNREKYFPTVYTLLSEDGSLGVFADLTVDTKAGLTEAQLRDAVGSWLEADPDLPLALVGDWNVAPRDEDVWDVSAFAGATHVSAPEREAFAAFESVGMSEVTRPHVTNYTFWDYQRLRFPRNEGMRIDFAYASPALAARVVGAAIDRDERKGKGASDHVPVVVELA